MINAIPGMGGMPMQNIPPELLASPQFMQALRAQMTGGGGMPAMGGARAPMLTGMAPGQQPQQGNAMPAATGLLSEYLRGYLNQQGSKFGAGGDAKKPEAQGWGGGLLDSISGLFSGGGAKSAVRPEQMTGLLGGMGGV